MIDDDTKKQMAERAATWLKADGLDGPRVTRRNAINEDHMALDVLDLLGELTVLRALVDASESRKDMLAAHLWLTDAGVQPSVRLAERVKALTRSRDEARGAVATLEVDRKQLAEVITKTNDALNRAGCFSALYFWEHIDRIAVDRSALRTELEHLQPLASIVGDWDWTQMDRHDLARDEHLAQRVCDAFRAVEAAERKAKEASRG